MNKSIMCAAGFFFLAVCAVSAADVQFAEMYVVGDRDGTEEFDSVDFSEEVFHEIVLRDTRGLIGYKYRDRKDTEGVVNSEISAAKACEIHGWELLVYGQITLGLHGYDAEIKIYNHPERRVVKRFLLRAAREDLQILALDCAERVSAYFAEVLQVERERKNYITENNAIVTSHVLEWWGTGTPWNESVTSIIGYQGRVGFRLGDPLWTDGEWAWLHEYGLGIAFHFGTSVEGVIESRIFDFDVGPDVTWAFVWQRRHEFVLTAEPCAKIHVLNYQSLYESAATDVWVWYGLKLDIEYRLWVNSKRTLAIGIRAGAGVFFTEPMYVDYHIGAGICWKGGIE